MADPGRDVEALTAAAVEFQTECSRLRSENERLLAKWSEADALWIAAKAEVGRLREAMHYYMPQEGYCPACGCYMPMTLEGSERVDCGCGRTPPLDHLPPNVYACPTCAGLGRGRYGCWGTPGAPHEHAYMQPVHELVAALGSRGTSDENQDGGS